MVVIIAKLPHNRNAVFLYFSFYSYRFGLMT